MDSQLEAIRTSELDKEIMLTLRASTSAMKKAGIGVQIEEAERVMTDLDDTMNRTQDLTSVLSAPLAYAEEDEELDAELDWLEETPLLDPGMAFAVERPAGPVAPVIQTQAEAPSVLPSAPEPPDVLEAVV